MDPSPMLICYDGSDGARRAIDTAGVLFPTRRAVVLDVGPPVTTEQAFASAITLFPAMPELNEEDALARAAQGADYARAAGLVAEARGTVDTPTWHGILELADEIDAAVIIVGSNGVSRAREVLERSVSHDVSTHSQRPVLVVPPPRGG